MLGSPMTLRALVATEMCGFGSLNHCSTARDGAQRRGFMWWSALITQNKTNELTRVQHTQSEGPATVSPTGEDQFRLMVDEVHDYAIVMLDPDGRIVSWNKGAQRLKGYEEAEIIGEPMERLY